MAESGTNSPKAECQQLLETEGHLHVCVEVPHFQTLKVRNPNPGSWALSEQLQSASGDAAAVTTIR